MILADLFLLLLFTGGNISCLGQQDNQNKTNQSFVEIPAGEEIPEEDCSIQAVLKKLNLDKKNDLTLTRPVKNHTRQTELGLEMLLYAILDVTEIDQTFVSYIWTYLTWTNDYIKWDPNSFCGLRHILVPKKLVWMPDLTIEEMTEQDKSSPSPYVNIRNDGIVEYRNDQVVISTCKMHVYKFPFDVQSCNISFKSVMYSEKKLHLFNNRNDTEITNHYAMRTQYEWLYDGMTVTEKTVNHFGFDQTVIIYTITMKRRSILYIANFLLPIFFFLCLDLASLLMSDGGEKVGFKVTVLLAVTVMQLILNEILPCSSDRIPLIAVYCIGTFTLMLISLLETILVIYLLGKDSAAQNNETHTRETKTLSHSTSVNELFVDESPSMAKKGSSRQMTEESLTMEKISDELEEIKKTISLLSSRKEDNKAGYWTKVAQKINYIFTLFYLSTVIVFLATVFTLWVETETK